MIDTLKKRFPDQFTVNVVPHPVKNRSAMRGFLSQDKEVPTQLAHKASKEVLTQDCGKKTARHCGFSPDGTLDGGITYVKFPAKSVEFGGMEIFEESPGAFIISVGNFTHCHMDLFIDAKDEVELARIIADLLEDVFNDRIICHGAHETGGGFQHIKYFKEHDDIEYFTWSGKYKVSRKPLVRNKHWYTEPYDYADDRDISWDKKEKFWLDRDGELVVRIARVYAVDEFAFTEQQDEKISKIIETLIMDDVQKANCFMSDATGTNVLQYSFEPVGIQIGGQLKLKDFENWEFIWHNLLELAAFPYKYEDDPDFTY